MWDGYRDSKWLEGNYDPEDPPIIGQRLARKLGMMTYRSAEEWVQRFGRERATAEAKSSDRLQIEFSIESYLEAHALKFTGAFDANCYPPSIHLSYLIFSYLTPFSWPFS